MMRQQDRELLKLFEKAARYIVRAAQSHTDDQIVSVTCDATKESVTALQQAWDENRSDLQTKMPVRPGPMNWPTDILLMDTLSVGDWRALARYLEDRK
jgi:3'-phosphoadenosine 5'-phosphosulfate sulfotransferase (PAPS reductase)/FAD synthetase